jgi:iron complex outermembrane receptor protein
MRKTIRIGVCAAACALGSAARAAQGVDAQDLNNLSIEQLANLQVRSVSKREEPLSSAPAALYVIDHDQIVRSGALTIPEMLRLAPNLQVYHQTPAHWVVTARGLNGDPDAQSFSNKLLVLVDGRTVYTPLFSGVYWDLPDLIPDDIERIEVISGPGATLWGANAVNGVINIITRSAGSAAGAYANVQTGTSEQVAGVRFSGQAGESVDYRAYGRWLHQDAFDVRGGGSARDGWHRLGGGFRIDWTPNEQDTYTVQGDIFDGRERQGSLSDERISGRDLVARWNHAVAPDQQLQVQAFYDRIERDSRPDGGKFHTDTYDVDFQHSLPLGARHSLVWGGGARLVGYRIDGTPSLFFVPDHRNLLLANLFAQDTFALSDAVSVTAGLKAEHDPYVGVSFLPDVRIAVQASPSTLLWGAVSHAVRSPTPFDEDVQERVADIVNLSGNREFVTEKLTAYEAGVRTQPLSGVSLSLTGFYHAYDDLRTLELTTGPAFLNLMWGNGLAGHIYGVEAWASAGLLPWWQMSAGMTLLKEKFRFKRGSSELIGPWQNGLDPGHTFNLRSSMNLGSAVTFDVDLRAIGRLHHSNVPAYAELNGRLGWNVSDHLTLALSGANLLHSCHVEYPGGDGIERKVLVGLEWRP